jgi:TolB protein
MRKIAFSRTILILLLVATLVFVSIVEAGIWSSPSMVTDPAFFGPAISGCPSISGDGNKIAFVTLIDNASEIFVINSDGSGLKQLTDSSDHVTDSRHYVSNPSISGDGNKIAFTGPDPEMSDLEVASSEIFMINSDGTGLTQLTDNTGKDFFVQSSEPSISGDGSKIAFRRMDFNTWDRGIFVINSDGTEEKMLTNSTYYDQHPSISDDGNKIAFQGGDDFDFQIFIINSDGTGLTQLTQNSNSYQKVPLHGPSISGDGDKIAFEGYVGEDTEIFVINSDGTGLRQLTDNNEDDWAPAISGDGNRIVFQRSHNQHKGPIKSQIFVINSDGTGLTQLTDDSERSFMFPSISDNGERMAFWSASWTDPESEVEFEYEVGISVVSYLSDVEDEKSNESTFPTEIAVGGTLAVATAVMTVIYLKRKKPWEQ